MVTRRGAWIRYQDPLSDEQLDFAVEHYEAAILQPWETEAAGRLKEQRPDMTVLAYKCLSSVRDFEQGPVFTSGVSLEEAEEGGEEWFAHREDGSRIQWATYRGHWQMAVWDPEYRERWCDNVADFLEDTPWDGVMADNDIFDDYYGLRPPIEGGRMMADLRRTMDEFVPEAGKRLNGMGKLLVPHIAESPRDPGRWAPHAAYRRGFPEIFLGAARRIRRWLRGSLPGLGADGLPRSSELAGANGGAGRSRHQHRADGDRRHRRPPELSLWAGRAAGIRRR